MGSFRVLRLLVRSRISGAWCWRVRCLITTPTFGAGYFRSACFPSLGEHFHFRKLIKGVRTWWYRSNLRSRGHRSKSPIIFISIEFVRSMNTSSLAMRIAVAPTACGALVIKKWRLRISLGFHSFSLSAARRNAFFSREIHFELGLICNSSCTAVALHEAPADSLLSH